MYGEEALLRAKAQLDKDLPIAYSGDQSIIASFFEEEELLHDGNARSQGNKVIIQSDLFCMAALPYFYPYCWPTEDTTVLSVDPYAVVAGKFYPYDDMDLDKASLLADELDALADQNVDETAKYTRIGPFNIYAAYEGKNRVSLYRDLQRPIRASVHIAHYPAAKDLELIRLTPHGIPALTLKPPINHPLTHGMFQFVHTSTGPVALLPIKGSVEVLEKYGVKWGASRHCPEAKQAERRWLLYLAHNYYEK